MVHLAALAQESSGRLMQVDLFNKEKELKAQKWNSRYNIHKYWGKKPANIVSENINKESAIGGLILDPFCGSGVTVIEAVLNGRQGIGIDLNPVAVQIAKAILTPVDFKDANAEFVKLKNKIRKYIDKYYGANCPTCNSPAYITSVGYNGAIPVEVRIKCVSCGRTVNRNPIPADNVVIKGDEISGIPDAPMYFGWEMAKLKRRHDIKKFSDLLTKRNLLICGILISEIKKIRNIALRELFEITFTANLAQCTRMIPDYKKGTGGPSWKINCYWLPTVWQELNPWHYFENRFNKSINAKKDIDPLLNKIPDLDAKYDLYCDDARNISKYVKPGSVDFCFTDPPYGGEGIQYGELSLLWNLWLGKDYDLRKEIVVNPIREKTSDYFIESLADVFDKISKSLKPDGKATITFHNKESELVSGFINSLKKAGFYLIDVKSVARSAPSLTEHVTKRNPKSDLVFYLGKKKDGLFRATLKSNINEEVKDKAIYIIKKYGKATSWEVLDAILLDWIKTSFYYEEKIKAPKINLDIIEKIMSETTTFTKNEVTFREGKTAHGGIFEWTSPNL